MDFLFSRYGVVTFSRARLLFCGRMALTSVPLVQRNDILLPWSRQPISEFLVHRALLPSTYPTQDVFFPPEAFLKVISFEWPAQVSTPARAFFSTDFTLRFPPPLLLSLLSGLFSQVPNPINKNSGGAAFRFFAWFRSLASHLSQPEISQPPPPPFLFPPQPLPFHKVLILKVKADSLKPRGPLSSPAHPSFTRLF